MIAWYQFVPGLLVFAIAGLALALRKKPMPTAAVSRLVASQVALSASVDAAVTALGSHADDSAQLNAVSDALDAAKAKLDAAVAPPVAVPPVTA
jgi:hypothetical protein